MLNTEAGRFHALLIGIDNYPDGPLAGCVNDIDQVQAFLIDKLAVAPEAIVRIEAPVVPPDAAPIAADRLPDHANLVAALQRLATPDVQRGDRVFIYYSGHGSYEKIPFAESYFEGLVPLDYEGNGLLFDVELNQLLQAIADRSGDLTVILDCCHSAGATREVFLASNDIKSRFLPIVAPTDAQVGTVSVRLRRLGQDALVPQAPAEYTVVAACHADEVAAECRMPPKVGQPRGLFSYYLFDILNKVAPQTIAMLRWSDIWEQLKSNINTAQPNQRPVLLGPQERRVFGGPWEPQDTGYAIQKNADGSYRIAAGSLAGLGVGAQVAVYGPAPARFPLLNSEADRQARLGILVVDSVQPGEASARPSPKDAPAFAIPSAARGRLIKQGTPDLLRVAVSSDLDPEVRGILDKNAPWDRFVLLADGAPGAEARVGQYANGDIWIGDDLFGPGAPTESIAPGPMGRVSRSDAADAEDLSVGLRAGLNHYAQYVVPLRAYRNGGFTLPAQAVEVRVLDCTDKENTKLMERDASVRREARRDEQRRCYAIANGTPVAFHIHNLLSADLYVFLLLCNLEGQIELLDSDVVINSHSGKIFWHRSIIGKPFEMVSPDGHDWGIDRLVVIATDQKGMDLRVLDQKLTMNDAIREAIGSRSTRSTAKNPPALCWSAVQTLIQIGDPAAT